MPTFRELVIVTERVFGATLTVPANPVALGSV
jgi:hypothetical protein